jgi:phosphoribosyl-AMP cyclohydrolase
MRRVDHHESGFTLAETLVAMLVTSIIVLASLSLFFSTMETAEKVVRMALLHQQSRDAFELLWLGGYRSGLNACINNNDGKCSTSALKFHNYNFGLAGRSRQVSLDPAIYFQRTAIPTDNSLFINRKSPAKESNAFWGVPNAIGENITSLLDHSSKNYLMGRDDGGNYLYYLSLAPWGGSFTSPSDYELRAANLDSPVTVVCVDANGYPFIRGCKRISKSTISLKGYLADDPVIRIYYRTTAVSIQLIDVNGIDVVTHRSDLDPELTQGSNPIDLYKFNMWTSFSLNVEDSSS